MKSHQKSWRIKDPIIKGMDIIRKTDQPENALANELLDEALRMRMHPGIVFAEGVTGRRARIAGTGIEVWEVIDEYKEVKSEQDLKEAFPHLTDRQLIAVYKYYRAYPAEIDELIKINETITAESVAGLFAFRKEGLGDFSDR